MKLFTITILLLFSAIVIGQKAGKISCEPILSIRELHNIIKQVVNLRHIDTNCLLIAPVESLELGRKDPIVLNGLIKPLNPGPYHSWAQLDSADVDYMLCTRRKHKRLEWNSAMLGFANSASKTAISFSFPYVSQDRKYIIVGYNFYGWYVSENSFINDGGYTLAIIKEGDKISVEELSRSLR